MLTFSKALILFSIVLTAAYTTMLWSIARHSSVKSREEHLHLKSYFYQSLKTASLLLSIIGLGLTLLTDFRETLLYYLVVITTLLLLLLTLAHNYSSLILTSAMLWHLTLIGDKPPETGIAVSEGMEMIREMATHDHWFFEWAHNPGYNPLPTIAFIQATLSRFLHIEWYNWYLTQLIFIAWAHAYDLAIFLLTYHLTNCKRAALYALLLIAITPETAIHTHPYQWSGNMLALLALLMFIKYFFGSLPSKPTIIVITILYLGAILAHATGLAFLIMLIMTLISVSINSFRVSLFEKMKIKLNESITPLTLSRGVFRTLVMILVLITLLRASYVQDYAKYVLPNFESFVNGIILFIREFLLPSEEITLSTHTPLYERAGLSFVQAYIWVFAISVALAHITYSVFLRRQIGLLELIALAALFIIAIVGINYAIIKNAYFYAFNRTSYVFVPFIIPAAALVLRKTTIYIGLLKKNKLTTIALLSLILFLLTAPIAVKDPNISPIQGARVRYRFPIPLSLEDVLIAKAFLNLIVPQGTSTFYIHAAKTYIYGVYEGPYHGWRPMLTYRFEKALDIASFIEGRAKPEIIYVDDMKLREILRVYNSIFSIGIENTCVFYGVSVNKR